MYVESEDSGKKIVTPLLSAKTDIQNDLQTWPLLPFDTEKGENVKMWLHIFIQLENTDILTYRSTKSGDLGIWLIFLKKDFEGDGIEGQHEGRSIWPINTSNWRSCQDEIPKIFCFDNFVYFKFNSKVNRDPDWCKFYFFGV